MSVRNLKNQPGFMNPGVDLVSPWCPMTPWKWKWLLLPSTVLTMQHEPQGKLNHGNFLGQHFLWPHRGKNHQQEGRSVSTKSSWHQIRMANIDSKLREYLGYWCCYIERLHVAWRLGCKGLKVSTIKWQKNNEQPRHASPWSHVCWEAIGNGKNLAHTGLHSGFSHEGTAKSHAVSSCSYGTHSPFEASPIFRQT